MRYLHNALGQRVFKGEIQVEQTLPEEETLGVDFIAWLKSNFWWLFNRAQANTSIGTAYSCSVLCQHRIEHLAHKALAGLGQLGDGLHLLLPAGGGPRLPRAACC